MTEDLVKRRKKLIETCIPLAAINEASFREKSLKHAHPSSLHLWWSRKPLAAARAILICQLVDDPSDILEKFPDQKSQEIERDRIFSIITKVIEKENLVNEDLLKEARELIDDSWQRFIDDNINKKESLRQSFFDRPAFLDPFSGGGTIPLEASRLGITPIANDLSPVAALINKAMIEIPQKFHGLPPISTQISQKHIPNLTPKKGTKAENGLQKDVLYYGQKVLEKCREKSAHLYEPILISDSICHRRPDLSKYLNRKLNPIAYIWARTVRSPSPSFRDIEVPLVAGLHLSRMKGQQTYVKFKITERSYKPIIAFGDGAEFSEAKTGTKLSRGANFKCIMSGDLINPEYIKSEGISGRMGKKLLAIVCEGDRERVYLDAEFLPNIDSIEKNLRPKKEGLELPNDARNFWTKEYGLTHFYELFTDRQIESIESLSTEIKAVESLIKSDLKKLNESSHSNHSDRYNSYADAIITYLGLTLSGLVGRMCTLCVWDPGGKSWGTKLNHVFARQALPMTWGFAEGNPFGEQTGSYHNSLIYTAKGISTIGMTGGAAQSGCATKITDNSLKIISTDPPYFDMISYADLSDFFYIWLRKCLKDRHPSLFATISAPRSSEIVAATYRHGGKEQASLFFESKMFEALKSIRSQSHPAFPVTFYYAFKQSEIKSTSGVSTTGWEAFLSSLINAGFSITATWPLQTELSHRTIRKNANNLSSSIVIACRPRDKNAGGISKAEFKRQLRVVLTPAIQNLERENIAPVDMTQAAIGPGMSIYSSAGAVFNSDDSSMSVREALHEISAALDEFLALDESTLDNDSLFAITFFESYGYEERPYGDAEGLAVARNISVQGVTEAGIMSAIGGKARLLRREQLEEDWDPFQDNRLCVWETTHHLIRRLDTGGESSAAALLAQLKNLPGRAEMAANCRALAYRLYNHCEKTKQTEEARAYNGLVIAWPELERLAAAKASESAVQTSLI